MSKQIQIYEVANTDLLFIITQDNSGASYYDKNNLSVKAVDGYVVIYNSDIVVLRELPRDFVSPKESGVVDLVEVIRGYIDNLLILNDVMAESESLTEAYLKNILQTTNELNEKFDAIKDLDTEDSILGNVIVTAIKKLLPQPTEHFHISGVAATHSVKVGAGVFRGIIFNAPTNNIVTIYDNISANGKIIAIIDPLTQTDPFQLDYHVNFHNGLTIVTAGTPNITVITDR